ncbi:hypothetical protein KL930_005123 [Ogataea haglerorum]|uniref:Uncharacterized protein n=1 Tax=Ogataea haglerorum TaxID=1937702 RepID=A0AAN6HYE0_9ASCO|nr:uncharacterized protein KL911_005134 [Ogataea haglerorum]KAG7692185.1 hypothetical protein KL951_005094 [Ogataea haglerorum]KAG7724212.1 hypothetical protein KL933_004963 [Ogataea haglerorum]KAG7749228.1 hypothetical protein KL911_005134 [Ogataea haglerorum]KAG7772668.1 hypothetical protein KL930_005123 [Ogataea haglerorum]KAG7774098.1 hypothetical protein KL922_004908 [Ogataea haglerorum]
MLSHAARAGAASPRFMPRLSMLQLRHTISGSPRRSAQPAQIFQATGAVQHMRLFRATFRLVPNPRSQKDAWHLFDTVHALALPPRFRLAQFTVPRTAYQGTHRWMNKMELLYKTVDGQDAEDLEELDRGLRELRSDQFDVQLQRVEEVPEPGRERPTLKE